MKAYKLMFLVIVLGLTNAFAQQSMPVKEALKSPKDVESIVFDAGTRQEKKLFKKWASFPELNTVVICETYDPAKLNKLITAIAANDKIEAIYISAGQKEELPTEVYQLNGLSTLKIFGSPNIDQEKLATGLSNLKNLENFSWINNGKPLSFDLATAIPGIRSLELMDTAKIDVFASASNLDKATYLENLTILINDINSFNLSSSLADKLTALKVIDYDRYKVYGSQPEYLDMDAEVSEVFTVTGKHDMAISYYGGSSLLSQEKKSKLVKALGTYSIVEQYSHTEEKMASSNPGLITAASPLKVIEVDTSSDFEHSNPKIVPPIKEIKIPKSIYTVSAETATSITRNNGTVISIPPDAFVDKNGNPVTGEVTVTYKEYMDPLSIFASGIPMTCDSGTLSSGGMFELYAFSGKEEVKVKEGKEIDVEFASIDDGKVYNFYEFENNKNEWSLKKENWEIDPSFKGILNNPLNVNESPKLILGYDFDTTTFENRYNDLSYFNLFDNYGDRSLVNFNYYYVDKDGEIYHPGIYIYKRKTKKNLFMVSNCSKRANDTIKHTIFKVSSYRMKVWFPELKVFSANKFYSEDFEKYKLFKEHLYKDKVYSDVRMKYEKGNNYCTFILKSNEGFVNLDVNIYDINAKNNFSWFAEYRFNRKYIKYQKRLKARAKSFDESIEWNKKVSTKIRTEINGADIIATLDTMGKVKWAKPINSRRGASINTGLYNCDRPIPTKITVNAVIVNLNLQCNGSNILDIDKIYVFDVDLNGYLSYNDKKVILDPVTTTGIIIKTKDGSLYYSNKNNLNNTNFGTTEVSLNVVKSTSTLQKVEDLVAFF